MILKNIKNGQKQMEELGVSDATICNWRSAAREEFHAVPGTGKNTEGD